MQNAKIFRSLNERIAERDDPPLELVCECDAELCTERVVISPVEFWEVRRHRGWYIVSPGHEHDARIVDAGPAFVVVETAA